MINILLCKILVRTDIEYAATVLHSNTKTDSLKMFRNAAWDYCHIRYHTINMIINIGVQYFQIEPLYKHRKIMNMQFIGHLIISWICFKVLLDNFIIRVPTHNMGNHKLLKTKTNSKSTLNRMVINFNSLTKINSTLGWGLFIIIFSHDTSLILFLTVLWVFATII